MGARCSTQPAQCLGQNNNTDPWRYSGRGNGYTGLSHSRFQQGRSEYPMDIESSIDDDEDDYYDDYDDGDEDRAPLNPGTGRSAESPESHSSTLQFGAGQYFCTESEGEVRIDVVRLGPPTSAASVFYRTVDSTAKAGTKYKHVSGRLEFFPGDLVKSFSVPILQSIAWDATLEFKVLLDEVQGAVLGKYLNKCRVKIIDEDWFPTNKFKREFETGRHEKVPSVPLLIEYVKLNLRNKSVYDGTVKTLALDFVKNLYYFLTVYLQMYLVDVVLAPPHEGEGSEAGAHEEHEEHGEGHEGHMEGRLLLATIRAASRLLSEMVEGEGEEEAPEVLPFGGVLLVSGSRKYTAIVVGLMYVIPFALLHKIDLDKIDFMVAGTSRQTLQANLLQKFLNYKEEHRKNLSVGDVTMVMMRDVMEVVDQGFMKLLEVVRIISKLAMAMIFILAENKMALLPLFGFSVIMGCFLCIREGRTLHANEEMAERQNKVVHTVDEAVKNRRMMEDFQLRSHMVDTYEKCIAEFNASEVGAGIVMTNNMYLPPWLITLLIGGYMAISTSEVNTLGGSLSLGAFLATLHIFREVGVELSEIYAELMEVQKCVGPLRKVARLMNLETDTVQRMMVSRSRNAAHKKQTPQSPTSKPKAVRRTPPLPPLASLPPRPSKAQAGCCGAPVYTHNGQGTRIDPHRSAPMLAEPMIEANEEDDEFGFPDVDAQTIDLRDVCFEYGGLARNLFLDLSATFKQGTLVAFVGPPHQGKTTLLKLIGGVLLPENNGTVHNPPHLRLLHLSSEVHILDNSLFTNIVFNQDPNDYGGKERVEEICRQLKFSVGLMKVLQSESGAQMARNGHAAEVNDRAWRGLVSHTDVARLSLARAFVNNPEVLVMHKPTINFGDDETMQMLKLLRRHVDERGICMPLEERASRRPRTIFFSSSTIAGASFADVVYRVQGGAMKQIDLDELHSNPGWLPPSACQADNE